jgi:hypothetical protein
VNILRQAAGDPCFINATLYFSYVAGRFGNAELIVFGGMVAL